MRRKAMSLRRSIKRHNAVVVYDYVKKALEVVPITNKNKVGQRYRYSQHAKMPYKYAYSVDELHDATVNKFTHTFKDGQKVDFLSSVMLLGPLAPIVKPKELVLS